MVPINIKQILFGVVLMIFVSVSPGFSQLVLSSVDSLFIPEILSQADKYFLAKKLDSAEMLYNFILSKDSKNIKALIGNGKVKFTQDEFEDKVNKASFSMQNLQQKNDMHAERDYWKYYATINYLQPLEETCLGDIEFDYFYGIINREVYKFAFFANRSRAKETAKKCFESVIRRDSCYKDVLLQKALLYYELEEYSECLDLIKRYIKFNPNSSDGYISLYEFINKSYFYEGFGDTKDLFEGTEDIDIYGRAVAKRKNEDYEESISELKVLLDRPNICLPFSLIYSELLKNYAALDSAGLFASAFEMLMLSLSEEKDCDIHFYDLKYLATKKEFEKYYSVDFDYKKKKWFFAFWARRVINNEEINSRIFEHYKRLVYVENEYCQDRESFSFFKPSESYNSNKLLSDQGFIFVKFGEPDKKNVGKEIDLQKDAPWIEMTKRGKQVPQMDKRRIRSYDEELKESMSLSNESWLYLPSSNNEKRIFHFFGVKKILVSMIYNNDYINAISDWDPVFEKITFENRHSLSMNDEFATTDMMKENINDSSKVELVTGVSQDRSSLNLTYKKIDLDFECYRFRIAHDKTQLMIAYFLPLPDIFNEIPPNYEDISMALGYNFYDQDWNLIAGKNENKIFQRNSDGIKPQVKFLTFETAPGNVNSSIFCNPAGMDVSCFNKRLIDIQEYPKDELCASDIMISVVDHKSTGNGKKWNNLYLLPSPTNKWSLKRPVNLYYEIYNLKKNLQEKVLYHVELAFRFKGNNENVISKIFSKNENEIVSTEFSQSGKDNELHECISFDVSRLSQGIYIVEITVKDINANKSITLKKEVELY